MKPSTIAWKRWLMRRRLTAGILGMLILAVLVYAHLQPARYRLVARYQVLTHREETLTFPCAGGFLLQEEEGNVFTLRDWQGRRRWRVTTALPQFAGIMPITSRVVGSGISVAFSPNGRYFAAVVDNGAFACVQIWREGRRVGETQVPKRHGVIDLIRPRTNRDSCNILILDSGRAYVWDEAHPDQPITVIEGHRVVASGDVPLPPGAAGPGPHHVFLTPDGQALHCAGWYYSITLTGKRLVATPRFTMPGLVQRDTAYAGGAFITADGARYRASGMVEKPNSWLPDGVSPGGRYLVQYQPRATRIISPAYGDHWQLQLPGQNFGGVPTADGRYALVHSTRPLSPQERWLRKWLPKGNTRYTELALYERPGRLRARLRWRTWDKSYGSQVMIPGTEEKVWLFAAYPSPDGKAFVAYTYQEGATRPYAVLLFRR